MEAAILTHNEAPQVLLFMWSGSGEYFYDVVIGIADIELHDAITAWAWPTDNFNVLAFQVVNRLVQIVYLEGEVAAMASCQFIAVIARIHLRRASRCVFPDDVYLLASMLKPRAWKAKSMRSGNLFQTQNLPIKMARSFNIFDHQCDMIEFTNIHL